MHELSLVLSIVDIATTHTRQAGAQRVESIELDIGELAGVEEAALDFAWQSAVRGTVLAGASRLINRIPGLARCADCGGEFAKHQRFDACPQCGSYLGVVLSGDEMRVKALTVV